MGIKSKRLGPQPNDLRWQVYARDDRLGEAIEEYLRSESAKREVTRKDAVKAIASFRKDNGIT